METVVDDETGEEVTRQVTEPVFDDAGDPVMAPVEGERYTSSERFRGLLETYQRIAAEKKTDMLLFVAGENVPELEDPQGRRVQERRMRLKSRLYFITQEGNIYQIAYGRSTEVQLLNYLFGNANTENILASLKFMGREMFKEGSTYQGFDGAAVGFTLPYQEDENAGSDNIAGLAFGELLRNMGTMEPRYAEQAGGAAVTQLLASRTQRDVYAAFYRGGQKIEMDEEDPTKVADSKPTANIVDVMWRRIHIDPLEPQMELRAVSGWTKPGESKPTTAGVRWRHEIPETAERGMGYGLQASTSEVYGPKIYQADGD